LGHCNTIQYNELCIIFRIGIDIFSNLFICTVFEKTSFPCKEYTVYVYAPVSPGDIFNTGEILSYAISNDVELPVKNNLVPLALHTFICKGIDSVFDSYIQESIFKSDNLIEDISSFPHELKKRNNTIESLFCMGIVNFT
jgi:hypothetical protein